MNRTMCGGFLLATLAALAGCSGDPTNDLVGTDLSVQASPTSLFMAQGENKPVIVTVTDAQGNDQDIPSFQVSAGSGAVAAVEDTTYQPTNNGGRLPTTRRVIITGQSPAATTVTITANGQALDVPVRVTPIST